MLQASDLTKSYDGAPLFDGLSFVLGDGERAGLVGRNGVGKTTLLRLLAGVDRPDRGAVATSAGARIGWLPQEAPDAATTLGALLGEGLGEVWSVRRELHALEARLERGDTSQATLAAYGHAQERFGILDGWALDARLDEARLEAVGTAGRAAVRLELMVVSAEPCCSPGTGVESPRT